MNTQDTTLMILEKLCFQVFKDYAPVYFVLDRSGNIRKWGGNFSDYHLREPEKSENISKKLSFMEGILPLKGQSMEFSCIQFPLKPEMSGTEFLLTNIDAQLFKTEDGYGLILWKTRTDAMKTKEDKFLAQLFQSLNFAVLEMDHKGHFVLIGTPPDWIEQIPQSAHMMDGISDKEDVFSFLKNFIQEVKEKWESSRKKSFKSGIWTVKDHSDQEMFFEATAVNVQGRKLLIISHEIGRPGSDKKVCK